VAATATSSSKNGWLLFVQRYHFSYYGMDWYLKILIAGCIFSALDTHREENFQQRENGKNHMILTMLSEWFGSVYVFVSNV
jgi:hypothetical protein